MTTMTERPELEALPSTAPGLLHSLRTLFEVRCGALRKQAIRACKANDAARVPVKFFHRCMEVTAYYDRLADRFTELRACDIADVDAEHPAYCIILELRPLSAE